MIVSPALSPAYEEVLKSIAHGSSPSIAMALRPPATAKARGADLVGREKNEELMPDDKDELDHDMQLEHQVRLARARGGER